MLIYKQLARHEGRPKLNGRAYAYQDTEGLWTIGTGRLIHKGRGGLTDDECDYLLANDVKEFEAGLDANIPWWRSLDPVRQRVILDMAFNLGVEGLLEFRNTLAYIRSKDYANASKNMLLSKWAKQVGTRSITLSEMMKTGKDPDWLK